LYKSTHDCEVNYSCVVEEAAVRWESFLTRDVEKQLVCQIGAGEECFPKLFTGKRFRRGGGAAWDGMGQRIAYF
jgi:hypothetical protein